MDEKIQQGRKIKKEKKGNLRFARTHGRGNHFLVLFLKNKKNENLRRHEAILDEEMSVTFFTVRYGHGFTGPHLPSRLQCLPEGMVYEE
jgi:hypothetical protein